MALTACAGRAPPGSRPQPAATAGARHPRASDVATLYQRLCAARRPCTIAERFEAGVDAGGRRWQVVRLALTDARRVDRYGADADHEPCERFEYWRVRAEGDGPIDRDAQLLATMCNDGYGAAGVGEDIVHVGANRFTHVQYGGSAWRWSRTYTLQISPAAVLASDYTLGTNLGPQSERRRSSGDGLWQRNEWYNPRCPAPDTPKGDALEPDERVFRYDAVPVTDLPDEYRAGAWRSVSPGACALALRSDASGGPGFALAGARDASPAVGARVVTTPAGEVFVEVSRAGAREAAVRSDQLGFVFAESAPDQGTFCWPPAQPEQQTIWLAPFARSAWNTAAVRRGIVAERSVTATTARLRVQFAELPPVLTVVYQPGGAGVRAIATSAWIPGRTETLGYMAGLPAGVRCTLGRGALVVQDERGFSADTPIEPSN